MARKATLIALSCLFLIGIGQPVSLKVDRLDGGTPVVFGTNRLVVAPGDTVTFTISLTGPATGDEVFTLSAQTGAFTNLPETISPEADATSIVFQATVSNHPQIGVQVVVTDGDVSIPTPTMLWTDTTSSGTWDD